MRKILAARTVTSVGPGGGPSQKVFLKKSSQKYWFGKVYKVFKIRFLNRNKLVHITYSLVQGASPPAFKHGRSYSEPMMPGPHQIFNKNDQRASPKMTSVTTHQPNTQAIVAQQASNKLIWIVVVRILLNTTPLITKCVYALHYDQGCTNIYYLISKYLNIEPKIRYLDTDISKTIDIRYVDNYRTCSIVDMFDIRYQIFYDFQKYTIL